MKRRSFLKLNLTLGSTTLIPSFVGASSIYGQPGSLSLKTANQHLSVAKFSLSLANMGVPFDFSLALGGYIKVWENLYSSANERQLFSKAPEGYIESFGLSPDLLSHDTVESRMLTALSSGKLQTIMDKRNIKGTLSELKKLGLINGDYHAMFKKSLLKVLSHNEEINRILRSNFSGFSENEEILRENNLEELVEKLKLIFNLTDPGHEVVLLVTVLIVITAGVLLYVVAAISFSVGLTLGVELAVVTHQAVAVQTGTVIDGEDPMSSSGSALDGTFVRRLNSQALSEIQYLAELALIRGDVEFFERLNHHVYISEIEALLEACNDLKIIDINPDSTRQLIEALSEFRLNQLARSGTEF